MSWDTARYDYGLQVPCHDPDPDYGSFTSNDSELITLNQGPRQAEVQGDNNIKAPPPSLPPPHPYSPSPAERRAIDPSILLV